MSNIMTRQETTQTKERVIAQLNIKSPIEVERDQSILLPTTAEPEPSCSSTTTDDRETAKPQDSPMTAPSPINETSLSELEGRHNLELSMLSWNSSWNNSCESVSLDLDVAATSPLETSLPASTPISYKPCALWQRANSIYAQMFAFSRERAALANHADEGSLVKVVKFGWGSVSLEEKSNPLLIILKEVDQQLFWDLDPVTKIANLYKSWLLLKVF